MIRLAIAAICSIWFLASAGFAGEGADGPIFELRRYTTPEGRLPDLHRRFRDHTVALFAKHGAKNVIYWVPGDEPNTLVYLLKHDSQAARDASFAAFRADPEWQKVRAESEKNGSLTTKVESTILKATDYSPTDFSAAEPGSIYELRIYTTEEGRLPALNARFRDHTCKLFEKHGMHNSLYTTPQDAERQNNTLVYVIAHKDQAAADASWKAFGSDPEWKQVAAESQKDGRILKQGGVKRIYLRTTDYSPIK